MSESTNDIARRLDTALAELELRIDLLELQVAGLQQNMTSSADVAEKAAGILVELTERVSVLEVRALGGQP